MKQTPAARPRASTLWAALSAVSIAMLAACGGGGGDAGTSTEASASPTLSGTVAVGAPITQGKLRVLDADGTVVASDVSIDDDGHYAGITLTGTAPFRLEACGYAGPNYQCVYSVAQAAGTANVTPLSTATVLLASGQAPASLMSGSAPALTSDSVAAAQAQLRAGLASVLASAGMSGGIDFVSTDLSAGSRTGYDGVLDAVGVNLGQDATAFVQITPRLGQGNLYLEQGHTSGTVTSSAGAADLQLSGLEALFQGMTQALASPAACSAASTGIAHSLAAGVRMSLGDGDPVQGVSAVADGLCGFFASGDDGNSPMWGSRFLSPTLGRCDLSGASPVCGVSFVLQSAEGDVRPVGEGMGVTKEAGAWKFLGDLMPIQLRASAKAQRTTRVDGTASNEQYDRALAFEVPALSGLACAKVSQRDADGVAQTIAFYKRHPGATDQRRLSLWTPNGITWGASTDPLVGATRSADDTWIALPQGSDGDTVIRNFYRGGRSVNVALYADAACSTPFMVEGHSDFDVDMEGVPPVWASMPTLPWPELDDAGRGVVRTLAIDGGATGSLSAGWTFPHGPLGLNGATVCGSRADCGEGGTGRVGESSLRPTARNATIALHNIGSAIGADDQKTLALYGATGDGVDLQTNFSSCPASASGESCH